MKVLIVEPGKAPLVEDVRDDIGVLQGIVDGWLEIAPLEDDVVLICDEEGKLRGKEPNRYIDSLEDVIVGTFMVAGSTTEGDLADLTDEQIEKWTKELKV